VLVSVADGRVIVGRGARKLVLGVAVRSTLSSGLARLVLRGTGLRRVITFGD
jgi:hypothetical protein